jgi:type IV secretory pathway VirB2 component (pilin)
MFKKSLLVATSLVASSAAFAQESTGTASVTSTLAEFTGRMTGDLTTVGIAMITLAAIAVGFKWIKGALFG